MFLIDEVLKQVAPAFFHGLIVSYADNKVYNRHRKLLGITHNKVPAISINNNGQQVIPYPEDEEISVETMTQWLSRFIKGKLESKTSGFGSIIDAEIKYLLSNAKLLTRNTFTEAVYEEEEDALVLVYTSSVEDETQRLVARKINELS